MTTLLHALEATARAVPERGISIFDRRGQKAERRTYPQLLDCVRDRAARMAAAGIAPGDRLLACLPTCWELLEFYLGAIYRGAQPVLVAPPGALGGAAAHAHKIATLLELLSPRKLICDDSTRRELHEFGQSAAALQALACAELFATPPAGGDSRFNATPGDLAFLQLTSGSTGRQRAVMIPHAAIIHNTQALGTMTATTKFGHGQLLSWLPLNHDMGLVGCLMFALHFGLELTLLRPETFLARPLAWLRKFGPGDPYMAGAPNFAYQLCVDRVDDAEAANLSLSAWNVAITGAEMIRSETCRDFARKFGPAGFRIEQFVPSYGLAETTLAATADFARRGVRVRETPVHGGGGGGGGGEPREVVCTGRPVIDTEIHISAPSAPSPAGAALPADTIGEVWIKSPSVFAGYYNDAEATRDALTADGWLRTGDLGFLHDGELYLTGRLKDLLIVHGHNLMPHELEWIAEAASGGGGAERCGAFSVPGGAEGEQAVLVLETADRGAAELEALGREIRSRIGRALGLPLADLLFVKRGQLPKTTSGKVQRRELRQRYLESRLERL